MTVENAETGLHKNRNLRAFDGALEEHDSIGMVVSDADSGKVVATVNDDGAVGKAERIAASHGFTGTLKDDDEYGQRMFFEKVDLGF